MGCEQLTSLTAGMAIPFGGDRLTRVSDALAAAFRPGDRLIVVQETGELLHVPAAVHALATAARLFMENLLNVAQTRENRLDG